MKPFRTIAATALFAAATVLTANAQQAARPAAPAPAPAQGGGVIADGKVAIIDTSAFADQKAGIARLLRAFDTVDREFKPRRDELQQMRTRLDGLAKEIDTVRSAGVSDEKALQTKIDQAETLKNDIDRKQQDGQRALDKRVAELTQPIYNDIATALQAYARQRGITVVFDISKMAGAMFVVNDGIDITDAFIKEYNSRNPATAAVLPPQQ